jgi:hypothetical protein
MLTSALPVPDRPREEQPVPERLVTPVRNAVVLLASFFLLAVG